MEEIIMSPMATWLNETFSEFDLNLLTIIHNLGIDPNGIFQTIINVVAKLLNDGNSFFFVGFLLLLFKKTRKVGVGMLGGLGFASIFGLIFKPLIARPRPYMTYEFIREWFDILDLPLKTSFSFPSGHTALTMAAMTGVFIYTNKKYSWTTYLLVLFVAFGRLECLYHYPTDVIGGLIIGLVGAIIGSLCTELIYYILNKYSDVKLFNFALNFNCGIKEKNIEDKK